MNSPISVRLAHFRKLRPVNYRFRPEQPQSETRTVAAD